MKHAGIHWPENAGGEHPNRETIAHMPGMAGASLICAPSARYHYDYLRRTNPDAVCVWRAIPRQNRLPAKLGWNPVLVAGECLNLWDEQPHSGLEYFQPLNELQFEKENGGSFPGYGEMAINLDALRLELERQFALRGQDVKLLFPPWVPMDEGDHLEDWAWAAERWDVIGLHCYGAADTMFDRYASYRDRFPQHPIQVGEWNSNHEGHDERASLEMWADIANRDPGFMGATYYIWETNNQGERDLSIWGNPERYALFQNPPALEEPEPEPEPMPQYRLPTWTPAYVDIRDGAIQVADERGLPRRRMLGLCLAECGFSLQSFDRWASVERTKRMVTAINLEDWTQVEQIFAEIQGSPTNDISFGPCHQTWYWWSGYPGDRSKDDPHRHNLEEIIEFRASFIEDHGTALRTAAGQIARDGDDLDVLCLYNKPNVAPQNNPNRPNYQRALVEADRILAEMAPAPIPPTPEPIPPSGETTYEHFTDTEPAGTLNTCQGVILHGSRSGVQGRDLMVEWRGTAGYEVNNPLGLGWNATIGPGVVALHLDVRHWGWNARNASDTYVAVEIAQPTVNDPLPNAVPRAVADYIFDHVWPAWGETWHFPSHAELEDWGETGANDGKTDLYPTGDPRMEAFREQVYARLNERKSGQPQPGPEPPADAPTYEQLATLEGVAYHEDGVVIPTLQDARLEQDWGKVESVVKFLRENDPHRNP